MTEPNEIDYNEGAVLLLNKPIGWTSFDLVKKMRNITKAKKVGHAGTLDPLATGLMILCTGKMTKQIDTFQAQVKEYTGRFTLGETTASYDREQPVDAHWPVDHITAEKIHAAATAFTGKIAQIPPAHSAIKVDGKRAYEMARKGQEAALKSREIDIFELEITEVTLPNVSFRVVCSKGTYIRSLVHDMGKWLASGATLDALCRTRIGSFHLDAAKNIEDFLHK
ncbi:MAG: tRNA pseudouridine(55) synthase TruB [Bacteroidia bacterium]